MLLSRVMPNTKARALRREMTEAERLLWSILRHRQLQGYKFRRQRPIGRFIVDFVCLEHRLIVEADGGQHADNPADARRTAWLEGDGWTVLRFWNNEILDNAEGVALTILSALERRPSPSRRRRRAPPSPAPR